MIRDLGARKSYIEQHTVIEPVLHQLACDVLVRESHLERAELRGLGGAGFSAGRKWRIVHSYPRPRLMAVNIDEGEPGTFKDCHYLERYPHRILEGMLIAARAVDADTVYIYLRDEYAGCRAMLSKELDRLVAEPPCPIPPIYLRRGAGAYICGEESAMIESIEGKRGMPRLRPPYIAERGLFDRPTLEHNMETLYWGHRDHRARSKLVRLPGPSRPQGIAQLLGEWPGGKTLIVMDPRRTPLARHADYVLQFRPDTDVAMLNAIMQSVIEQGLVDTDFIARRTEGFEALKEHLADFTPEKMAPICGIEADTLREVARIYAASGAP